MESTKVWHFYAVQGIIKNLPLFSFADSRSLPQIMFIALTSGQVGLRELVASPFMPESMNLEVTGGCVVNSLSLIRKFKGSNPGYNI